MRITRHLIVAGLAALLVMPALPAGVAAATPVITWNAPAPITYGTALSSTQLDATVDLQGSLAYTPPEGTVLHSGSSQTLTVDFTPSHPVDDTTGTSSVSITVNKKQLTVTANDQSWAYGTSEPTFTFAYGGFVNNDTSAVISGTPSCTTTATAASQVGDYPITCDVTGLSAADYTFTPVAGTLHVVQATPILTWATPIAITYGTALSATQLDATANVNGAVVDGAYAYTPDVGTLLDAGTQNLSVTFTPNDATDYTTATGSTTLTVNQVTPTITWPTPASITYGTALSSTQLNATASVSGTFSYTPASGTVPDAGVQNLSATFTPTDSTNFTAATGSASLAVTRAPLSITASSGAITYGSLVPAITPSYVGLVNGDSAPATPPSCSTTATSSSPIGTYPTTCSGASDANYQISYAAGSLFIVPPNALPILTVTPDPKTRPFGTANPAFTYVISGLLGNQTLTTAQVSGTPACTTTA
ncbi:MAG: MBG domain-containing protein, partial [Mycobacterium sp.]|nr:MBG domain-containing protein [Mycobacterium sp.]